MKQLLQNAALKKGLFALAVVAVAGASGLVYAQTAGTTNSSTSGYGTSSQTQLAALATLSSGRQTADNNFRTQVHNIVATFKANSAPGSASADTFGSAFDSASATYDQQMTAAENAFQANVQQAASTAENKDQFVDRFNHAKADYLNTLDAAKNQFADVVNKQGNASNVAKDQFMNDYNKSRDTYSNQLEVLKNDFAATISNSSNV